MSSRSENRQDPIYGVDGNGNMYVSGYRRYVFTRNEAIVSATATMLARETGTTIHATSPAVWQQWAQGSPPDYDAAGCMTISMNEVVSQLVEEFAIIIKVIEVEPDKAFRITTGKVYDGKWQDKNTFTTADTVMTVVINLPQAADRNRFRLAVIRKGTKEDLSEYIFDWSSSNPVTGLPVQFSPAEIAAAGGGPGTYTLKFYAGVEPAMERDFYINKAPQ